MENPSSEVPLYLEKTGSEIQLCILTSLVKELMFLSTTSERQTEWQNALLKAGASSNPMEVGAVVGGMQLGPSTSI